MSYEEWLETYNGDHARAGKAAWEAMQLHEAAHKRMTDDRDELKQKLWAGKGLYEGVVERCQAADIQAAQAGMRLRQCQDERDALKAYSAELELLVRAAMESDNDFLTEWDKEARDLLAKGRETSLAKLKAQTVAEALDMEAGNFERDAKDADTCTEGLWYKRAARSLREASARARRQAEAS